MSVTTNSLNTRRLIREDFNKPCRELAVYLLGKILVRNLNNIILKGRIVETESYLGGEDKGSHTYNNRRTARNEAMYMSVGTSYVYMTYGMYYCFNISSKEPGAAVLLRALEPLEGLDIMKEMRAKKNKSGKEVTRKFDLCNGPSKLCTAMSITKDTLNKVDLANSENNLLWLEDDPDFDSRNLQVVNCARIGIPRAEEWAIKPLRYYVMNNKSVSKRDKIAERLVEIDDND